MKYYEIRFKVDAPKAIVEDVKAVLAAITGEAGLETFEDSAEGITGYAQTALLDRQTLDTTVAMLPFEQAKVSYEIVEAADMDWNEQWEKEGFAPIEIGSRLVVHDRRHLPEKPFDIDIEIDAKLAFGTGSHETTRMILAAMLNMDLMGKKVLDCGCGTGILSIAALKMGANEAVGYDIDEWSVENSRHNAILNGVENHFSPMLGNSTITESIGGNFDLVVANINRNILIADMPRFANKSRRDGTLILSGFYVSDIAILEDCASQQGFTLTNKHISGNWCCLIFTKN